MGLLAGDEHASRFREDLEFASRVGRHGSIRRCRTTRQMSLPVLEFEAIKQPLLLAFDFVQQPGAGKGPIILGRGD